MKQLFVITILLVFLIGCAASPPKPVGWEERLSPPEGEDVPEWTTLPSRFDTEDAKGFCGTSHNFSSDGEARDNAIENARKQIIDAMGTFGRHVINEVISSVGNAGSILNPGVVRDDAIEMVSESLVSSRASEFFVERWSRVTPGGGISYFYRAYVLVLWNNDDAQQAISESIRRQAQEAQEEQDRRNIDRALEQMDRLQSGDW